LPFTAPLSPTFIPLIEGSAIASYDIEGEEFKLNYCIPILLFDPFMPLLEATVI
jgi:hypothetical protein